MSVLSCVIALFTSFGLSVSPLTASSLLFVCCHYNIPLSFALHTLSVCVLPADHRAVWRDPARALWTEPVLHCTKAHRHSPVWTALASRELKHR